VFVPPGQWLDAASQGGEYDLHLPRLAVSLLARPKPGGDGLAVDCGPGPTCSQMLQETGHPASFYDRFYADDGAVLSRS